MRLIQKPLIDVCLISMISFMLTACSNSHHKKMVEQFIADTKAHASQKLPPLPPIKTYAVSQYNVTSLRSPFEMDVTPASSLKRPKEPLENFALDSLHLVGIIERGDMAWGLIAAPDNKIYPITVGQHLGQNSATVLAVHPKHLDIIEEVDEGDHTTEQNIRLSLSASAHTQEATK